MNTLTPNSDAPAIPRAEVARLVLTCAAVIAIGGTAAFLILPYSKLVAIAIGIGSLSYLNREFAGG